ncbi:MAG: type II toxin-antitoxin system VapC family toxin [Promethearchaeota archaeon]
MIIIDTNVAISIIHEKISISDLKRLVMDEEIVAITAPTMYELYFGLFKLKRKKGIKLNLKKWNQELKAIEKISIVLPVLPYTLNSAKISADLYTKLISKGQIIELFDCMIAGTALSHDFSRILTTNIKHFDRIPNFQTVEFPS